MAVWLPVQWPHCHSTEAVKNGKSAEGNNATCQTQIVRIGLYPPSLSRTDRQVKQQIVEMTLNGSGIRDIARVLHVSTATVIQELKKSPQLESVNQILLSQLAPEQVEVEIVQVEEPVETGIESSLDEMWRAL